MKTTEQLNKKCDKIIDLLSDCNVAEKYRIIKSLWESLNDVIKSEGLDIIEMEGID